MLAVNIALRGSPSSLVAVAPRSTLRSVRAEPSPDKDGPAPAHDTGIVLLSPAYLSLLLLAALLGIPISFAAFGFLVVVHELEHALWDSLPTTLGFDTPPAWWAIATIGFAGLLVGLSVRYLPGRAGHVPAAGLSADASNASALPGVILAAVASLSFGAVLGPEAPLIAIGGGLALLAANRTRISDDPRASALIVAAGSAAAIAAIFGNPLVAAIIFLEIVGLSRGQTLLVVVPCMVSSGVGALVFTGLGDWTGLEIGALAIPDLEPANLEVSDLLLSFPLAAAVAVGVSVVFVIGRWTAAVADAWPRAAPVVAGLTAGGSAALYSMLSSHSPEDVALSGQVTLETLAGNPEQWSAEALALLLLCKGFSYALCLGAFRGGPVFPAAVLGAAAGVLAGAWLPGIATVSGIAVGMAAGVAAVTRLPVTSTVLVVLLLGAAAMSLMPVVILAVITAMICAEALSRVAIPNRGDGEVMSHE